MISKTYFLMELLIVQHICKQFTHHDQQKRLIKYLNIIHQVKIRTELVPATNETKNMVDKSNKHDEGIQRTEKQFDHIKSTN